MSNVTAPPPATPTGQGGGQGGAAQQQNQGQSQTQTPQPAPHSTSAVSLAGTLAGIDAGARLAGLILGGDAAGQSILRTDQGTFVIVGRGPMPANTQLQIQVLNVGPTIQAMVLARDGKPLHPPMSLTLELAKPAATQPAPTQALTPSATPTAPLPALQPGAQISAIVLPQPVPGTAATALAPGTALTLQVTTVAPPPAITPGPAQPPATPATPTTPATPAATPLPEAARHPASPVQGLRVYSQVAPQGAATGPTAPAAPTITSLPPASPTPTAPQHASPVAPITATVIGRSDSGQLTVRSPAGLLALNTATDLAPGSRVTLQVVRQEPATQPLAQPQPLPEPPPLRLPATGPAALAGLLRTWPTLEQSVEQLKAVDHGMFQRVMVDTVPTPTARLASAMLLFISALRGGDLSTWLGADALRQLEQRGRPDIAGRLGDEFQRFAAVANEPGGSDWRMFAIPLFDGWRWYQLQLFARRHRREHGDGDGEEETRFVLDFDLSRLGGMQLDGLVREKHFDLIIRSETPLTRVMRDDIGLIFKETLEIGGCAGSCVFQAGRPFPVDPLAEMSHHDDGPAPDPATVTV